MKTLISAIPPDRARLGSGPGLRGYRGFTLVELLVVFAMASVLIAIVPIAFQKLQESAQYRQTVRNVLLDIRTARHLAMTEGRETLFTVDLDRRRYGVGGQPLRDLPESLEIRATVASVELSDGRFASIRFLPSGGATGGSLDILRAAGSGARVNIDWLTGRAMQQAIAP